MSRETPVCHPLYGLLPTDVEGFDSLAELALDIRSEWNHATYPIWRRLDPVLWKLNHNPWGILQTVSREKLRGTLAEPAFRKALCDEPRITLIAAGFPKLARNDDLVKQIEQADQAAIQGALDNIDVLIDPNNPIAAC